MNKELQIILLFILVIGGAIYFAKAYKDELKDSDEEKNKDPLPHSLVGLLTSLGCLLAIIISLLT